MGHERYATRLRLQSALSLMSLNHKKTTNMHRSGEEPFVERGFSAYLKQLRKNPRLRNPVGFANNTVLPRKKK